MTPRAIETGSNGLAAGGSRAVSSDVNQNMPADAPSADLDYICYAAVCLPVYPPDVAARPSTADRDALGTRPAHHDGSVARYGTERRASWSSRQRARILLGLLIQILPESWPIVIAVDETLERRIGAKGMYRDAVRSSQNKVVTCLGLEWICMALLMPVP